MGGCLLPGRSAADVPLVSFRGCHDLRWARRLSGFKNVVWWELVSKCPARRLPLHHEVAWNICAHSWRLQGDTASHKDLEQVARAPASAYFSHYRGGAAVIVSVSVESHVHGAAAVPCRGLPLLREWGFRY